MDSSLVSQLTSLGPGLLFAALIFFAYERSNRELLEVISKNTEAMTAVANLMREQCESISTLDDRAQRMETRLTHADEALTRIETQIKTPRSRAIS